MKNFKSILLSALLVSLLMAATSCDDNLIYENEGDCTPKVQFIFKKHRQAFHSVPGREQDVFYSTIETVHLFVYDTETGELVFDKTEHTANLGSAYDYNLGNSTDRCFMPLDLKPGTYTLIAWCGLDADDNNNAFYLAGNESRANSYSECRIKLSEETGLPVHSEKYQGLYHGIARNVVISEDSDGQQIIPVELTKNNNDISVTLQHTSVNFAKGDYEVVFTDANGSMHFETNDLTRDDRLEYRAHIVSMVDASIDVNGSTVEPGAMIAHISTSRLSRAHKDGARLEVRDKEGKTVFSIPFIQYVLAMQTVSDDEQYYLDCEDTYNCSFFLSGDAENMTPMQIIINNWVKVPDQDFSPTGSTI